MKYQEIRTGIEAEQGTRWLHRVVRCARCVLCLLLLTIAVVYFHPSAAAQAALHLKIDALKLERDALQGERDAQLRKMEWIRSDVQYLEIAARDRLGLQKDGEFVIRFQSKEAPPEKPSDLPAIKLGPPLRQATSPPGVPAGKPAANAEGAATK